MVAIKVGIIMSCVCDDFFHNESEQFTFTCSARHGKKKLQFPSRKWSFDLIMRNRRKLSNHFLVKPVKPYLSFSNFSFLRIWLFVYKQTNSVLTQKHISDRSVMGVSKKHREHREAPRAPCVVKGRSLFPGKKQRCHGAFSLKRKSTVRNSKTKKHRL